MILLQRWTERPVHGCEIFSQSFLKWQIRRWGMASLPWQHYSGKIQNLASLLVQLDVYVGFQNTEVLLDSHNLLEMILFPRAHLTLIELKIPSSFLLRLTIKMTTCVTLLKREKRELSVCH